MEIERKMQEMLQQLLAKQEKAEADRIADRECKKQMIAKMDTKQAKVTKQEEILPEISARMDTNLNEMREDIKSGQAEMRSTLDEWLLHLKDGRKETTAWNVATETKLNPGLMQSREEHQDIPKGEAAVMLVREPRKRSRVCILAAERSQKRKERTQGNHGSRMKLATACRKVSRCAKVAWHKRNLFRKIRILEKCGQHKEFAAARIRATRCAKVVWRKGRSYEGLSVKQRRRKNKTENNISRET
jgi:hypothetical protein